MKDKKYRLIDLFSGCGGISKGFLMTGRIDVVGAIDFEQGACDTFKLNFPDANVICGDINNISVESTGFKNIDIIVGGPPCQGFSGLNRWEKDKDNDPRNKLFLQYLRFVDEIKPKVLLIENVRQILTSNKGYVIDTVKEFLEERGYNISYSILSAANYGVPQNRQRAIIIGVRKELGAFDFDSLIKYQLPKVTVNDALSDIEEIEDEVKKSAVGTVFKLGEPKSEYQREMHNSNHTLHNHLMYYPTPNVQKMISFVPEGGNWKSVPKELFKSDRDNRHSNYLKRLDSKSQSVTIDTGHNVYFHPVFNRVPTIREAARLQSFPDDFVFTGNKGQQFKQVGNAVPPLLARAIANGLVDLLDNSTLPDKQFKLVDLFCGAGGLSLGFDKEGHFQTIQAIDFNKHAIETYNFNRINKIGIEKDITSIDDNYIKNLGKIDGIIGGPPCQGFSTAGQRIIDDDRNVLYRYYFKILEWANPKFFVIENVVGILTFAKGAIKQDIFNRADSLGYDVSMQIVDMSEHGVPQVRKRVFFVGIKKDLNCPRFVFPSGGMLPISIEDAISDLPSLDKKEDNTKYNREPATPYQKYIRNNMIVLYNHEQSNHSEETKKAISLVPEGGSVRDIPESQRGGRNYHALLRKMDRKKPSLCIDTGHRTYFHYEEKRVPSVREVARLQSFTDDYVFLGPKQEQYKQVGNAVPPLFAEKLAEAIYKCLIGNEGEEDYE